MYKLHIFTNSHYNNYLRNIDQIYVCNCVSIKKVQDIPMYIEYMNMSTYKNSFAPEFRN